MNTLREAVQKGWPAIKTEICESLYSYFDIRDELTIQDNLIFKGEQLVIPAVLRREMMSRAHASQRAHASHIGIEGCIRRACVTMYCRIKLTELKVSISKCEVCIAYRSTPAKKPLMQHKFAARL